MPAANAFFPNGVSAGDATQDSAILCTHALQTGRLTFGTVRATPRRDPRRYAGQQ